MDHSDLVPMLDKLRHDGVEALPGMQDELARYRNRLAGVDPDDLTRDEALAYWLNLYNAGALDVAAEAQDHRMPTVLHISGGFDRIWVRVGGEELTLNEIEHGKLRRFSDPRMHGALACGAASCPALRYEPFTGDRIHHQLYDQLRSFLAGGGARADRKTGVLALSRVFLWFGGDFTRPDSMPTWLPARKKRLLEVLTEWLDPAVLDWVAQTRPRVEYQSYDWSLACSIG